MLVCSAVTLVCQECEVVLSRDDLLLGDRIRVEAQLEYLPVAELERVPLCNSSIWSVFTIHILTSVSSGMHHGV
eukprot:6486465-Amphidinium_carterae.1